MNARAKSSWIVVIVAITGFFLGICIFTMVMINLPVRPGPNQVPRSGIAETATFAGQRTPISGTSKPAESPKTNRGGGKNFDTAVSFYVQGRCAEAIPYLDLAIDAIPENGDAYYMRAQCYYHLADNQRYQNEFEDYIDFAMNDVDKAIIYGVTTTQPGDPYNLRYYLYSRIVGNTEYRSARESLSEISLDNLRMAVSLGTSDKYQEQWIPIVLFYLNRCDEGMTEVAKLHEYYGISAPPSASLINIEAHGYLCLGQLDKALEYVNKGLDIETAPEHVLLRSMILYLMGRNEDALDDLNHLIAEKPSYNGYRYFLRALIHYENGERDLAEEDLML